MEWVTLAVACVVLGVAFLRSDQFSSRQRIPGDTLAFANATVAMLGVIYGFLLLWTYYNAINSGAITQIVLICIMCLLTFLAMALGRSYGMWSWWIFAMVPIVAVSLIALTMTLQSMHFEPLFSLDK